MDFDAKIASVFEQMHRTSLFGVLKNTAEVIITLISKFSKSVVVNIVSDEIDTDFDAEIKKQVPCIYDRTVESCKILMGPDTVEKITQRVLMILPNHILPEQYNGVKKMVLQYREMAPGKIITFVMG